MSDAKRFDFFVYTQNKSKVTKALKQGDVDYGSFSKMGFVDEFFAFLLASDFFPFCDKTYPSPRVKEEVPAWFLLASLLAAKMYGEESFSNIVICFKKRLYFKDAGAKSWAHALDLTIKTKKRGYIRQIKDCIRKFFKDTDPDKLIGWFNHDFSGWMAKRKAFASGLFIEDEKLRASSR